MTTSDVALNEERFNILCDIAREGDQTIRNFLVNEIWKTLRRIETQIARSSTKAIAVLGTPPNNDSDDKK